jgi:hypothetical protein
MNSEIAQIVQVFRIQLCAPVLPIPGICGIPENSLLRRVSIMLLAFRHES